MAKKLTGSLRASVETIRTGDAISHVATPETCASGSDIALFQDPLTALPARRSVDVAPNLSTKHPIGHHGGIACEAAKALAKRISIASDDLASSTTAG